MIRRETLPAVYTRRWEGSRAEVAGWCMDARTAGQLVGTPRVEVVPGRPDQVSAVVRLIASPTDQLAGHGRPRVGNPRRRLRVRRPARLALAAAALAVVLGALATMAYTIALAIAWVIDHAVQIGTGLIIVTALVLILASRSGGGGRHCPGC